MRGRRGEMRECGKGKSSTVKKGVVLEARYGEKRRGEIGFVKWSRNSRKCGIERKTSEHQTGR